jgi:ATP-dependent helicase/nuclease subunit A
MVRSVTRSDLWKRARASPQRLVEVPFQRLLPAAAADLEAPSLVKGTIDLVFREADGWVVVDFKTHEGRGGRKLKPAELKDFAAQYRPQVLAYATAWKEMTGEPVHQTGLYFTHSEAYIVL